MFSDAEWEKISRMALREAPAASPTNRFADNAAAAALGQKLWFDPRFSGPLVYDAAADKGGLGAVGDTGKVSCASCHASSEWFVDTRSVPNDISFGAYKSKRNSPSMVNAIYYSWGGWGGAQDQFWKQGANVSESKDLNGDRLRLAHLIAEHYRAEYNAIFPDQIDDALLDYVRFPATGSPGNPTSAWKDMDPNDQHIVNVISANVGKSFEAYERLLVSHNAPIDRYIDGEYDALSLAAKRGLKLFVGKAACDSCHKDATFTDNDFHNTAVVQAGPPESYDNGHWDDVVRLDNPFNGASEYSDDRAAGQAKLDTISLVRDESMRGQFRTKSLRHVAMTAPYFHNGSAATLEDVVRFYNQGGGPSGYPGVKDMLMVPLNLTDREILDLVAFLKTLTGEPVPEYLTVNTAAP